jgi:hypothetical protein
MMSSGTIVATAARSPAAMAGRSFDDLTSSASRPGGLACESSLAAIEGGVPMVTRNNLATVIDGGKGNAALRKEGLRGYCE